MTPSESDDSQAVAPKIPIVWCNGEYVSAEKCHISPFDHGFLTGDGIFETMASDQGKPFAYGRHYQRLLNSASVFGLPAPDQQELLEAIREVLKKNGLNGRGRIRVTVTGGEAPLGSETGEDSRPTYVVAAGAFPDIPELTDVITVPFARNEKGALVGIKTISYGENVVALAMAKKAGCREAIFGNTQGELCEGTGSNIYVVYGGELITPPLESSGCLPGVTRALILELCQNNNIPVAEKPSPLVDLEKAEEAFVCSTLRDVQPIVHVNGAALPKAPGKITEQIRTLFLAMKEEMIANY